MTSSPDSINARIVKKIMGLPPGTTTTSSLETGTPRVRLTYSAMAWRKLRQTGRRAVVSPTFAESFDPSLDYVRRCIKIGLANLEVDDFFALLFKGARPIENFKGGFSTKPRHAAGQTKIEHRCWCP